MAYTDRTSGRGWNARRAGVALTVALLHGAAAVGLLSAFAGGLIQLVPKGDLPVQFFPVDPPTQEPTVTPTSKAVEHKARLQQFGWNGLRTRGLKPAEMRGSVFRCV